MTTPPLSPTPDPLPGPTADPRSQIPAAVDRLRRGQLVAFPTETVYGLGADACDRDAVARVFAIKGRPSNNPLIVHIAGTAMARAVAGYWPIEADRLAAVFWPGPLSIIVPRGRQIPDLVSAGGPTIAVRCPDHPLTLELIQAFGSPIVGPSANRSGRVSPTTAAHVRAAFSAGEVMVLDGGPCRGGIESTVVEIATPERPGPVRILRPGLVTPEQIRAVLNLPVEIEARPGSTAAGARPQDVRSTVPLPSPGLLDHHYAPLAPCVMIDREALAATLDAAGGPCIILSHLHHDVSAPHQCVRLPADPLGYANSIYAAMLDADSRHPARIVIVRPPEGDDDRSRAVWRAVMDRLSRATRPA